MRIQIRPRYLELIQSGEKTVEARVHSKCYKKLEEGDTVTFTCKNKSVSCEITNKIVYSSFREMLLSESLNNCLPDAESLRDGIRTFEKIKGYKKLVQPHGVFAIRLKLQSEK